jgi:hypothetical protein
MLVRYTAWVRVMTQLSPTEVASINGRVVNLVQAMLGSISENFRAVSIDVTPAAVKLHFLLERDSDADREEIDDIAFEYEALELGFADSRAVIVSVVESADDAPMLAMPGRRVFGRREQSPGDPAAV